MEKLLNQVVEIAGRHVTDRDTVTGPDVELPELGMGSLRMVQFMVDLESAFGVSFPEPLITPETFRTPRTAAEAISPLVQ
ncbi:hypothetical protein [Alloactinosynnema sp. L-07]|uniref:phosphopantetheine-binding protein n=1 Tax=Alloactinosynnema sp. L-07 TaxID=1653480 RepID=UPI00065EFC45|nr:phosphopantetheine-binding protein [Alloactinosynnema sp. L-07]CRK61864.1 hypothetical protein [Alloactinosynnema sp. L-07]